jgi:16S rRNA (cytosine967-C5)-methyltransferase
VIEVQQLATQALLEVVDRGRSLTQVLSPERLSRLPERDRGACQDCCYGVLRWLGTLREVLDRLLRRPPAREVEVLLLVALYQLEWTRAPQYAVVDSAVRACAATHRGAKPFVNAVLRGFLRRRVELLALARASPVGRYSYPQWWIVKVERAYPERYAAILDAGNEHPPMTLRVNRRLIDTSAYMQRLREAGITAQVLGPVAVKLEQPRPVSGLPGFQEGWVSVQDFGAQLAAPALDLRDGQHVLDACAAPGGKAAHLLETADVELTALDRDAARIQRVAQNLARLGHHAILQAADAADLDAWWNGQPFQRILLDAPCTASGVVRRHPDIKWLRRPSDLPALAREQARLLAALWRTLERGGKLLYVTCSLFPEENQAQISAFLEQHSDAQRLPLSDPSLSDGQLLPTARHDAFYYALLQKH